MCFTLILGDIFKINDITDINNTIKSFQFIKMNVLFIIYYIRTLFIYLHRHCLMNCFKTINFKSKYENSSQIFYTLPYIYHISKSFTNLKVRYCAYWCGIVVMSMKPSINLIILMIIAKEYIYTYHVA